METDFLAQHRAVAEAFIAPLKTNPDVLGIAYLGSLARQFADRHSDIDIAVFSHGPLANLAVGEQWVGSWDLDVFNISIDRGFAFWTDAQREAYQEGRIVHDPTGATERFLAAALAYSDEMRMARTVEVMFKLAWHGFSYTPAHGSHWRGYYWELPSDLWLQRGRIDNAFYLLRYCTELTIEMLYAINRRWLPDPKWRWVKTERLPWLPTDWDRSVRQLMMVPDMTPAVWQEKSAILQRLIDDCYEHLMPELPADLYQHLLEHSEEYACE